MNPVGQVWSQLQQADLVLGEQPETSEIESPWYVKVLLGFSGWLASIFMLGFVGIGFDFIADSSAVMIVIGALMILGSYWLLQRPKNEFVEHLTLAFSLAGQLLVVFAVFDFVNDKDDIAWFLIALIEIPLALMMPNQLHRFFSSFAAVFCLTLALAPHGFSYILSGMVMLLSTWLWMNEFQYPKQIKKMRAIGYGLIFALIQLKGSFLFLGTTDSLRLFRTHSEIWAQPWVGEVISGIAMLYVVGQILRHNNYKISDRLSALALLSSSLLIVLSFEAQGITTGIMILLIGFAASNRVLQGLGIISLLFYTSSYYYMLQNSLFDKALTLLVIGVFLLLSRWILLSMYPNHRESPDEQ